MSLGALLNDPTSHSETVVVREACGILKTTDLSGAILYASMQPCLMCFGASVWAKIPKIVFACSKEKVSEEYYGGHYDMSVINAGLSSPVDLVHISELEQASLEVVREWEASQTRSVS